MTVTAQSKDRHWKEVADSVSAVCGMLRTVESTKKKWSSLASDAKIRGVLQRRDQAKTGAGLPEVKPLTSLEEKILAVMGQVYTEGIATGTEVGLDELCEQKSGEVCQSTSSDPESRRVILTLMDSECDTMNLPPAMVIPSPAKKKKHIGLQEELLELEKEKLWVMREKVNIDKERLQLEKEKFEFMKEYKLFSTRKLNIIWCQIADGFGDFHEVA
ncbi:uncharacterized protein LOC143109885 [Alosa pseudoharengus]|uniref:uncharacterized protein LOC143109885 n=1 Tax=Alosa pseudoharengus TaxID=34774 RepID=UPI003F89FBB2